MKRIILTAILSLLLVSAHAQKVEKLWEATTLEAPESVVSYKEHLYVSNVSGQPAEKNGQGFISKLDESGTVVKLKWLTGFHAPKGLGIHNNKLYVADIDRIAVVDLSKASIEKWVAIPEATFLNDVEVAKDGTVYVTDTFGGNAIYQIKNGALSLMLKDEQLNYPNGLKLKGDTLYVATWGVVTNSETFETDVPGSLLAVDLKSKSITKVASEIGNLDGLINYKNGFISSDWIAGKLLYITNKGEVSELQDLNAGSADIEYLKEKNTLLVPQMLDGALTAYQLD